MIRSLQSLRFVFIYLVVISHFVDRTFDFGGECGVSFFFILSGFVLSLSNADRIGQGTFDTRRLFIRQLFKLYPLHLLTMVLMLAMEMRLGQYYSPIVLMANALLVQSWVPSDSFYFVANGSSWFLCDILFFYLIFRLLYTRIVGMNRSRLCVLIVAVLAVYIMIMCMVPDHLINPILYANPMLRILDFSIGILLYRVYVSQWSNGIKNKLESVSSWVKTLTEILLVISVCLLAAVYPDMPQRVRTVFLFWTVLPAVILYFAIADHSGGMLTRLLHNRWLIWAGSITFEIYLIHIPVVRLTDSLVAHTGFLADSDIAYFLFYSVVLITVSVLIQRWFVNPISKLNKTNIGK